MSVGAANYFIMVLSLVVGTLAGPLSPCYERQAVHRLQTRALPEHGRSSSCSPCGDQRCCCCESLADCAGRNLSYIPAFSEFTNISHLDFSNNVLQSIDENTLENITSFTNITLFNNSLAYVHPNSFENLTALQALNLDLNHLNDSEGLFLALNATTSLENLTVSDNELHSLNFSHVVQLRKLRFLFVRNNKIRGVVSKDAQEQDNNLFYLDFSKNVLSKFPEFCTENNTSVFPKLNYLDLQWNQITRIDNMRCLPNLTTLILNGNAVYHTKKNFLQGLPSLQTLYFKTCTSRLVDSHAFNHSGLQHLDVSENLWFFDHFYGIGISLDLFQFMPNLEKINISWTVFHFASESERYRVLSPLIHVKEFIMQGTGITNIPRILLTNFTNLTYLDVGVSEIPYLADNTFENLTNLRNLTISYNYMTTFSERLLEPLLKGKQEITLDFSGNPFSCQCDLLWLIELFQNQKAGSRVVFLNRDSYICTYPPGMVGVSLAEVSLADQACIFSYNTYIAILFVNIFTVVIILLCGLVYRFRWQCRFLVYTLQHRCSHQQSRRGVQTATIYDVFVSYDIRDNQWVHQVLQKELENNRRFRLCLHERDFIPGKFISHNIIERLEESQAILLVLSNSFLKSEWCRFEMFLGVKSGLAERKLVVVPVLLEDLDKTLLDSFVCTLLHTTTYIAWPARGTSTEIDCFWRNLSRVISERRRILQ